MKSSLDLVIFIIDGMAFSCIYGAPSPTMMGSEKFARRLFATATIA